MERDPETAIQRESKPGRPRSGQQEVTSRRIPGAPGLPCVDAQDRRRKEAKHDHDIVERAYRAEQRKWQQHERTAHYPERIHLPMYVRLLDLEEVLTEGIEYDRSERPDYVDDSLLEPDRIGEDVLREQPAVGRLINHVTDERRNVVEVVEIPNVDVEKEVVGRQRQ